MFIFKLQNETIICVISKDELDRRKMKIAEIAKGTENAQKLLMQILKHVKKHYNYSFRTREFIMEAQPIDNEKILLAIHEVL